MTQSWKTYEDVAAYLLNKFSEEFGLSFVEGKQKIKGERSGTDWEIDAKGCKEGGEGFVIVESRMYTTSKQNQEKVAGLAYRILDTGAEGGILVSPLGFQSGAKIVARSENILEVTLNKNSTVQEFHMRFLNKVMVGLLDYIESIDTVRITKTIPCANCNQYFDLEHNESLCPKCSSLD